MLCRERELTPPRNSMIVSEQAVLRFNTGAPLGGRCAAGTGRLSSQEQLKAFYPSDTRGLDIRFARLSWSDASQGRAAARFGDWLVSDDGQQTLLAVGLRPNGVTIRDPLSEQNGVLPGATVKDDPVPLEALRAAMRQYDLAHRQGRVLLALDASGSMGAAVDNGQTRFTVAGEGVRRAIELMGQHDEFGLWLFASGRVGAAIQEPVPIGPRDGPVNGVSRRDAAVAALSRTTPAGGTPLLRAIRDGVAAVGPSDDSRIRALVVLSDGEDTSSGLTLGQVKEAVAAADVRIFVIAVGETHCAAETSRVLSADSGGACYDINAGDAGVQLAEVFAALWGKAAR